MIEVLLPLLEERIGMLAETKLMHQFVLKWKDYEYGTLERIRMVLQIKT